jgi:hypothetical protein
MPEQQNDTNQEQVQFPPVVEALFPPFQKMNAMANAASQDWLDEKRDEFYSAYIETFNQVGKNYVSETINILDLMKKAVVEAEKLTHDSAGYGTMLGGTRFLSFFDIESIVRKKVSKWFHSDGWGS